MVRGMGPTEPILFVLQDYGGVNLRISGIFSQSGGPYIYYYELA